MRASPSYDNEMASHGPDSNAECCMPVAHSGIGMLLMNERHGAQTGMGSCVADASTPAPSAILCHVPGVLMLCAQAIMPSHALSISTLMKIALCSPFEEEKQCSARL